MPVKIEGINDAVAVTTGNGHVCALHATGEISCWGSNFAGELGTETSIANDVSATPLKVKGITDATAVATGGYHTCAVHESGYVTCWGWDDNGQLGDGQAFVNTSSFVPVKVIGF